MRAAPLRWRKGVRDPFEVAQTFELRRGGNRLAVVARLRSGQGWYWYSMLNRSDVEGVNTAHRPSDLDTVKAEAVAWIRKMEGGA